MLTKTAFHLQHTAGALTSTADYTICRQTGSASAREGGLAGFTDCWCLSVFTSGTCGSSTKLLLRIVSPHTLRRNAGTPEANHPEGKCDNSCKDQQHMHYLGGRFAGDQKSAGRVHQQSPIYELRIRAFLWRNAQGGLERTDLAKLAKRRTRRKTTTKTVPA